MHKRSEIKIKVKAILVDRTNAGPRVFVARFIPLDEDELSPGGALAIYTGPETSERIDSMNEKRVLDLIVELLVSGHNADDDLDALAGQVEHLMVQDDTMGDLTHEVALDRSEPGYDEESKTTLQALKMTYKVTYFVEAVADDPTDPFERAEVGYDDSGTTRDVVVIPQ